MVTSAYHPQSNGQAESTNRVVKERLRKLVNERQDNWDDYLEVVSHSINHNVRSGTKYSPYYILFGFHPRKVTEVRAISHVFQNIFGQKLGCLYLISVLKTFIIMI